MEAHTAPVAAKRMWSYLRVVFFMMRKGVLSKRKLLVGMHLVMKRRNKAVARSVANLLSHHGHGHASHHALRRREYEFSCRDSPDTGSFSMRRRAYFPCLGADQGDQEPLDAAPPPAPGDAETGALHRIEYYAAASPAPSSPGLLMQELAPGEECTPAGSPLMPSAAGDRFSVRVSNFSSEEVDGDLERGSSEAVDDEAEEFITRFYEQLRRQNQVAQLPYLQESAV